MWCGKLFVFHLQERKKQKLQQEALKMDTCDLVGQKCQCQHVNLL